MQPVFRNFIVCLILAAVLASSWSHPVFAAEPALTVTQKKNWDQTLAEADTPTRNRLQREFADFESLMQISRDLDRKIREIQKQNAVKEAILRKEIRKVDEARLARLKAEADQTKAKYQKLLNQYSTVNKQLESARKLKNKTLISLYQAQADVLKIPVQLAKQEIKAKEDAYQNAKRSANDKIGKLRDTLSGIDPVKAQIRSAKSALKPPQDSRWTAWKSFTSTLTKTHRNPKTAASLLASVNDATRQIIRLQHQIYTLESKTAEILRKTELQMANT